MDRSKFLVLTGMTESAFTTFGHHKLLPFVPFRPSPKAWAEYSLRDALLTDVMLAHMDQGLERVLALSVVKGAAEDLWDLMEGDGAALSDVLLGYVRFQSTPHDPDEPGAALRHQFACYLDDLVPTLEGLRRKVSGTLSGFSMVNVSERLDLVVARAKTANLVDEIQSELVALRRMK